jgi:hypothetical protein
MRLVNIFRVFLLCIVFFSRKRKSSNFVREASKTPVVVAAANVRPVLEEVAQLLLSKIPS